MTIPKKCIILPALGQNRSYRKIEIFEQMAYLPLMK